MSVCIGCGNGLIFLFYVMMKQNKYPDAVLTKSFADKFSRGFICPSCVLTLVGCFPIVQDNKH